MVSLLEAIDPEALGGGDYRHLTWGGCDFPVVPGRASRSFVMELEVAVSPPGLSWPVATLNFILKKSSLSWIQNNLCTTKMVQG